MAETKFEALIREKGIGALEDGLQMIGDSWKEFEETLSKLKKISQLRDSKDMKENEFLKKYESAVIKCACSPTGMSVADWRLYFDHFHETFREISEGLEKIKKDVYER